MTALQPRKQYFWGIVALVFGFLFGSLGTWNFVVIVTAYVQNHVIDIWFLTRQIWVFGMAVYLIFVGIRKFSRTNSGAESTISRIGWGRVVVGTYLIVFTLVDHYHPAPNRFQLEPSNAAEAMGMKVAEAFLTVCLPLLGVYLAVAGVRRGFKQSDKVDPNINSASHNASE